MIDWNPKEYSITPPEQRKTQDEIDQEFEKFLSAGGKIQQIPVGATALNPQGSLRGYVYGNQAVAKAQ